MLWLCAVAVILASVHRAFAHETDQYSVPVGRQFADLRFYFSEYVFDRLEKAVYRLNARIRGSMLGGRPTAATRNFQSSDALADAVYAEFPTVLNHTELLELGLREPSVTARFPGLVVAYMPAIWVYHHWALLLDVTKLTRLWRCSTVMINGTYAGTDKFVHFLHMGRVYHLTYRAAVAQGASESEATAKAVDLGTGADPLSERSFLGLLSSGVFSNGDLAADFAGLLFYRNLTDSVRVAGSVRPPMVVRDGEYFRFNDHVRRDNDFLSVFVSDHWDEVLNPNTYQFGMDVWLREEVRRRCDDVHDWYRDERGLPLDRQGFLDRFRELSTYWGEDYGHSGEIDQMVSAANECFPESRAPARLSGPADVDALGRTALWRAARAGRIEEVRKRLDATSDVDRADLDGETALHAACRGGSAEIVQLLLARGCKVRARSTHGTTPLHLAVQAGAIDAVEALLRAGALPDDRDAFGRTPLHDAATRSDSSLDKLLAAGGNAGMPDLAGSTPLHVAARAGRSRAIWALLAAGASRDVRNAVGRTPLEEAQLRQNRSALDILEWDRGGNVRQTMGGGNARRRP